jgi:hypothetical protein
MLRNKVVFFLVLVSVLAASSCTLHRPKGGGGGGGGGGGNATVSFTLVADTLPANPSILSFKVSVTSVVLTPTSGTAQTLTPATAVVDLMRLQSDTAFLGTLSNVPSGSYTVQVAFSNPVITFLNDTASAITAGSASCSSGSVCVFSLSASGTPTIGSFTVNVTSSGQQGVGIDFNLNNAISLASGSLSVNFNPSSPVLSAFTLPRSNANLGANQLDLIEDFTGVVSLNGNNVTLTSPTRGTLTVVNGSSSFFDASPDGTICATPATFSCVVKGQVASVDAFLNSNGTFSLKEFEPLVSTQQDLVEGTVFSVASASQTQFVVAVTDKTQAATGSLIAGLNTGDLLTVNLSSSVSPFLVDTKGVAVASSFPGSFGLFASQTTTAAIHEGQTVSVHVTAFTAANGTTPASATLNTMILRWSRFRAPVVSATSSLINVNTLPSYFNFSSSSQFAVQGFFNGALGSDGVTNLDGITSAGSVTANQPVGLRALYLQNPTNTSNPAFFAAKMRQP